MGTKKVGEIWKCEICGNIVDVLHVGGGVLVCCGKPMILQKEKMNDPKIGEKHVPIIEGNKIKVGSVTHPMDEDHYIEWIEASNGKEVSKVFLSPGQKPEAVFSFKPTIARSYCNIHGLWRNK